MEVAAVFTQRVHSVEPEESLTDAAQRMMLSGIGSLVILDETGRLIGILTERDLLRSIADGLSPRATPVAAYMSREPASASLDEEASTVALRMVELGIRHLPVMQSGVVVGMVSARDLLMLESWGAA